jgi:hypothetical protein
MNPDGMSPLPKSIGEDPSQKISNVGGGPSELLKEAAMPYQKAQTTPPKPQYKPYSPTSPTIDSPISSPNYQVPNIPPAVQTTPVVQPPVQVRTVPIPTPAPETDIRGRVIRTLEGDVANAIEKKKASALTLALAETERSAQVSRISDRAPSQSTAGLFKILFSLIFIAAGMAGLYYLYSISPLAPRIANPVVSSLSPSILKPDSQTLLAIDSVPLENLIRQVRGTRNTASAGGINSIAEIIFTKKDSDFVYRVVTSEAISTLGIGMPDLLARSLSNQWMFGWYKSERADPFIILKNTFFQNAFAGMLDWEETIVDDFADLFSIATPDFVPITQTNTQIATSTATSTTAIGTSTASTTNSVSTTTPEPAVITPPPSYFFSIKGDFEDKVLKNRDVRIFKSVYGNALLMYSFIDKDTVVITTSEAALEGIIERIERGALMR